MLGLISDRHFRRIVKEKKNVCKSYTTSIASFSNVDSSINLNDVDNNTITLTSINMPNCPILLNSLSGLDNVDNNDILMKIDILDKLRSWVVKYNVSHSCVNSL